MATLMLNARETVAPSSSSALLLTPATLLQAARVGCLLQHVSEAHGGGPEAALLHAADLLARVPAAARASSLLQRAQVHLLIAMVVPNARRQRRVDATLAAAALALKQSRNLGKLWLHCLHERGPSQQLPTQVTRTSFWLPNRQHSLPQPTSSCWASCLESLL